MFAPIRGTRLFFDIEGTGLVPDGPVMRSRPPAMVIHGGPGSDHSGMRAGMERLTARAQVIYFDHRALDENVEDMEALRQYLGLGPVISIGTSYGGMVAMAHAARYPASVSHLILIVTAAHHEFLEQAERFIAQRATPEQQAVCAKLWAGAFESPEELRRYYEVMGPLYSRRHDPMASHQARERTIYSPEAINAAFGPSGFLRRFDLRAELGRIIAPTLILAAAHDWICPPAYSEEIHRLIRGSDLRLFEKSGHSVRTDEPEAMLDAILGFIVYRRAG
ncbi:MAG: alpha/beta fold hydrolase [Acetobacteraceae bacterium]|nr:alpha/beta fold hydrolase [Acetobacteraceae bacterium]